ncbi:MAG TPA: class I tRNA ligase family protein [Candidatus Nanoarchaeia archaeon]|nr:class I tRNA ligase family protein [Candidatus Nanoarchaeia archaeon]
MGLKIYNTLTRKIENFKPLKDKEVKLFVCGPTVYDFIHIGNAKTFVQFDIIVKYLRYRGYKVFYIQNITDIDDKIIKKANEEKVDWKVISSKYEKAFLEDVKSLGITSVDKFPRATDYIKEIVSQVKRLIEKGFAYKISDGYYFDLSKFKEYGKLAKRTTAEGEDAVSRVDENTEKRNKGDFCLLKFSKEGEPFWEDVLELEVSNEEYERRVKEAIEKDDKEFLKLNNINKTKWKK